MSDIQLKPCPYCQSDNVGVECSRGSDDDGMIRHFYYGFCGGCHMAGPDVSNEEGEGIAEEQAAEAWNSLPRHLQWTTETPTEPGWYWWRKSPSGYTEIKRVSCYFSKGKKALVIRSNKANTLTGYRNKNICFLGGEWAGPILAPLRHAHQRRPEKG